MQERPRHDGDAATRSSDTPNRGTDRGASDANSRDQAAAADRENARIAADPVGGVAGRQKICRPGLRKLNGDRGLLGSGDDHNGTRRDTGRGGCQIVDHDTRTGYRTGRQIPL